VVLLQLDHGLTDIESGKVRPTRELFGGLTSVERGHVALAWRRVTSSQSPSGLQGVLRTPNRDSPASILNLELQQARYEASLAERRYAACDPDNRLIAAQLEKSWETALRRVETCEVRLQAGRTSDPAAIVPNFAGLADDLEAAWNAPGVSMRARQRLLRALVTDIIADIDEAAREVVLTVHWRGGQHSQLRVRKLD
jgi:hypothetical protein